MIQNQPLNNPTFIEPIRYWRPAGSQTVLWAQEMNSKRMYHLLRWGDKIYLPVGNGDQIGIGIYNGNSSWMAYPTYVEAANLWVDGQSEPEDCDTSHMWEIPHGHRLIMDALMNPDRQAGRPLTIVQSGEGFGIGESTFKTTQYRGQIRVYERRRIGGEPLYRRPFNTGYGDNTVFGMTRGGGATKGGSFLFSSSESATRGPAAIGAGREEHRQHCSTGVSYQRNAQPVISLNVEFRSDLDNIIPGGWGRFEWLWNLQSSNLFWWDEPWNFGFGKKTAPHIPEAPQPHTGANYR